LERKDSDPENIDICLATTKKQENSIKALPLNKLEDKSNINDSIIKNNNI
jgi:hypothetical protein